MKSVSIISLVPVVTFLLLLVLQSVLPKRPLANGSGRVVHNLLLFMVNAIIMRFAVPLTLVSVAVWSTQNNIGLFNVLALPDIFVWLTCVMLLDFAIYWQHVATHHFPLLWRMHKVHHADHEMDVTTAVRFHPVELVLSLIYKSALVALLGAPVTAVVIFELLLFIGPAFNHSNVSLPAWLDKALRWVIATPDVHRAHHSTIVAEQNTNYGFFLIWWDKLFATYTDSPSGGHVDMPIGLADEKISRVDQMLIAPFR